MAEQTVQDGKVVKIHYTLTDDDGEVLDSSQGDEPLAYLHGAQNIVPGLEQGLLGRSVGDKATVVVEPEDGYGERDGDALRLAPRDVFPDEMVLEAGMMFVLESEEGEQIPVWMVEENEHGVVLDENHPLAGVRLHFDVEVVGVRDATDEERDHGHPHGPGGHHH